MKKRILYLVPLFFAFAFAGCQRDYYVCMPDQKVVFQYECSNYAWVRTHTGWYIDSEGYVRTYNLPVTWNYPDSKGFLSKSDMDENLLMADSVCFRVDPKVLAEKIKRIGKASEGSLSKPVSEMCDAGIVSYHCFTFDSNTQQYRSFLLDQWGDVAIHNKSTDAVALFDWLKSLQQALHP